MSLRGIVILMVLSLAAGMAFLAGCGSTQMKSAWRHTAIDVTAGSDELQGALKQVSDRQLMLAFVNDSANLYIAMTSDDRTLQRQVLGRGLTVWFDHAGGEEHRFGIHYPLGMAFSGGYRDRGAQEGGEGEDRDQQWERPAPDLSEAEIIGPMPNEHHRVRVMELHEIGLMMDVSREGTITYRMKIPLMDTGHDPYGIGALAGSKIGIGFEAGARMRQPEGEGGERSGPGGGGGMGRRGGYGRGGGGGFRSRGGGQTEEPLQLWAQLQLAAGDSTR